MDKNHQIEEEVQKTIELLDNIKNVQPNPFLYTRIKAGIENGGKKSSWTTNRSFIDFVRPVFFGLLILINLYSLFVFLQDEGENYATREQYIDTLIMEYSPGSTSEYLDNFKNKE